MTAGPRVGVIGLGVIGGGIAVCLARAGMLEATFDVRPDAADKLAGVPSPLSSPAALAECCNIIILAVVDADQSREVIAGPAGLLSATSTPPDIILVATVALEDLRELRATVREGGGELIDCGVVGGKYAASNGLICLVGAEADAFERVRPALDGFARYVALLGGPDTGMTGKIVFNAILHGSLRAGFEGTQLARAAGIDIGTLTQAFVDTPTDVASPMLVQQWPGDPLSDPEVALQRRGQARVVAKDLAAAMALSEAANLDLPAIRLAAATVEEFMGLPQESTGTTS